MTENEINIKLVRLSKSKFRSKFHLSEKDKKYISDKGLDVIKNHANDFITKNLKFKTEKDGKQTPFRGHPVFVSQHATATCCRECLYKWYNVTPTVELNESTINDIVNVIMTFIKKEINYEKNN